MQDLKKYYKGSLVVSVIGIALAYIVGFIFAGTGGGALAAVFTASILSVLEVSLSIDNAVVNAKVLQHMDPVWRQRFITWGMLIAVFGMRLVFPLVIVSVSTGLMPVQNPLVYIADLASLFGISLNYAIFAPVDNVLALAVYTPEKYEAVLRSAHAMIMGFGGAFLMMVFLKFFIDEAKEHHWLDAVENKLALLGRFEAIQIFLTIAVAYAVSKYAHTATDGIEFFTAAVFGTLTYIAVEWTEVIFAAPEEAEDTATQSLTASAAKNGLAGFIYLEVLDASFSFDGVVGAFALTNNIFIILIGLGIGAMFVRSVTLQLVDKGTLNELRYLEHSAFWAIGSLATIMYANVVAEIPEVVTGLIGAAFIIAGVIHSIHSKKQEEAEEGTAIA